MPRKPATSQADTLDDIRREAFQLFGRYGYDGVSIDAIARASGLSKGALYWYFDGKQLLFLDCLKRLHALYDEHVFDPMLAEQDAMLRILLLFRGLVKLIEDPRVAGGVAGYWLGSENTTLPAISDAQREAEARTAGIVRDTLELGVQQGKLAIGSDIDDMSRAIIAVIEVLILPLRNQSPAEIRKLLSVLARTLVRAYAMDATLVDQFQEI